MLDYKLLAAVAAVVDEGSFERGARALHLTQSAVSQRIKLLEEQLGEPLLVRGPPTAPTAAGRALLRHFRQVAHLEHDLEEALARRGSSSWSTLPIAVNADSLATWFLRALMPMLRERRVVADLRVADQERTDELLRRGEVLGCISTRARPARGCRAHALGRMDYLTCASPAFAAAHFANGVTASAVRDAPILASDRDDDLPRMLLTPLGVGPHEVPMHYIPDFAAYLEACRAGVGYGLLPHPQAIASVEDASLVDLTPGAVLEIPLYWHYWDLHTESLRALTAALEMHARAVLRGPAS